MGVTEYRTSTNDYLLNIFFIDKLYIYSIGSNGLSFSGSNPHADELFAHNIVSYTSNSDGWIREELEICKVNESGTDYYYVAFGYVKDAPKESFLVTAKLNFDGSLVQSWQISLGQEVQTPAYHPRLKGLEFSPNGEYLYYTFYEQTDLRYLSTDFIKNLTSPPISGYTGTINTGTDSPINYNNTHIELGMDGNLYYINKGNGIDNGTISKFTNPDNPTTGVWTTNNYGINNIKTSNYQHGNTAIDARYIFADQIDGENYEDYYQTVSNVCCNDHFAYDHPSDDYTYVQEDANGDINVYAATDTWTPSHNPFGNDAEVYLEKNLIFHSGTIITISGMTFKFETGQSMILSKGTVLQGAKVTLNGTTLTAYDNCGIDNKMWNGVRLNGSSQSQYPVNNTTQPLFRMLNSSVIEYAETAVYSEYGGILQAKNSEFKDNIFAISYAFLYPSINTPPYNLMNASYVDLCSFRTTEELYALKHQYPNTFVSVDFSTRFNLRGVTMNNEYWASVSDINKRGNGLRSNFSQVALVSYCDNPGCSNETRSVITNLNYGATIRGGIGSKFDHAIFKSCVKGIQLKEGSDNAIVTRNDFTVYNNEDPNYTAESYGLSVEESTNYTVEENHFHNGIAGAYAIATGVDQNEIYKNYFYNLNNNTNQTGMIATGENSNYLEIENGHNGIQGLNIRCNNFNNTDYSIAVIDGNIGKHQTGRNNVGPAANWFAHDHLVNGDTDYLIEIDPGLPNQNDYVDIYTYIQHYHNSVFNLLLDWDDWTNNGDLGDYYTYNKIDVNSSTTISLNFESACPSNPATTGFGIGELSLEIISVQNNLQSKEDDYALLVDGGNTPLMLDEISGLNQSNYFDVCLDLLDKTPYLSDTVLLAFMADDLYRPIAKSGVLIANSPLPPAAKKEIENLNVGPFLKWLISQLQVGTYPRVEKELEIVSLVSQISYLKKTMVNSALDDSLSLKTDSVISFFESQSGYQRIYDLIPFYLKTMDTNKVVIALEQLLVETNGLGEYIKQKAADYRMLKLIELNILKDPANYKKTISLSADYLKSLAKFDYSYESSYAKALLELGEIAGFNKKYPLPSLTKSGKINNPVKFDNYKGEQESLINVYPNPSNDKVNIEYISLEGNGNIMFYDMQGKLFKTVPVTGKVGFNVIDVSDLPNGIYFISNEEFGSTNSVKITVQH